MFCPRCHGLMAKETCIDLKDEMGIIMIPVWHCLICGELVDHLILQHRHHIPVPMKDHARMTPKTAVTGSHGSHE